jgi:hypothetical protein
MNTPIVMMVSVILWSFGISAASLLGLMFFDWLELRRTRYGAGGLQLDSQAQIRRIQQPSAPRRRAAAPAAKAA